MHVGHLDKVAELRPRVGSARVSIQQMVAFVPEDSQRDSVAELAARRFAHSRPVVGTATELLDHYGRLAGEGVERVYTWFCDFAPPETLQAFGETVIRGLESR